MDGVSSAIVCGGMGRERNLIVDKRISVEEIKSRKTVANSEYIRRLTPREFARLQGFPDDFVLASNDTNAYKELGNTVTVPVIAAIAREIKAILIDNNLL